ncbi:MAG: Rieske 2Fe-2S domain-containing protein [Actinomycetota bacterium]|nr:Rieske 2Fe-2S domain-containing protein [Actinomycetota bacterium]
MDAATPAITDAARPATTVDVGSVEDLDANGHLVGTAGRYRVLVVAEAGRVVALDNRCPHMGFPLDRGTVADGTLTCHWHHARFDLASGCTFDPWADDALSFPVEVRDGRVLVGTEPLGRDWRAYRLRKLREGLQHNIRLVIAKSLIGLADQGATDEAVRDAALFGVRNRDRGWSAGLSILTCMANVAPALDAADRACAAYHGVLRVARSTAAEPPSFDLEPLATSEVSPRRLTDWFRRFVELRSASAAERTLKTAIRADLPAATVAHMVFAACTDHRFLDVGHTLDFANKAFELLDHIGWEHADEILPALIPALVGATRMEETAAWRHPVDIPALLDGVYEELDGLVEAAPQQRERWDGHRELAEVILDQPPADILDAMRDLLRAGVPLGELAAAVAYSAARRPVHFPTSNEHGDWDTVHHTFTYANAVDAAMARAPSSLLARGIFDAAMAVHLERFLNVPKRPIPQPSGLDRDAGELLELFDTHGAVNEAGQVVADVVAVGGSRELICVLGRALLREDAGFHDYQMFEAGVRQHRRFAGRPEAGHVLIGVARFLAAQWPTVRSTKQTYDIALRLHRGEAVHEGV